MVELTNDELLTTTRSVRRRLDLERLVPREVIRACVEIALQAPNGSNLNTWRWVIVDDAAKVERIGALYDQALDDHVATLGADVGENYLGAHIPGAARIAASVDELRRTMHRVPAIAIPLLAGRPEGLNHFYQASLWGSILQSVWSFFLALRSRGLGSAWTTAGLYREKEIAELLGIPFSRYAQVGHFPIAFTKGTDFRPGWRAPVEEVLSWNSLTG